MNAPRAGAGRLPSADAAVSHTVDADAITIHYLAWGSPDAPPLVLLHGGGQSAWTWQRVAERFADRYRVIAPDARGHGDSGWSPDGVYSMDRFRDDLHALVTQLGIESFVLAGMSMGGMTALAYGGTYGATLRGLVVIDIAPEIRPDGRDRIVGFMTGRSSFANLDEAVEYAHTFNPRRDRDRLRRTLPRNLRTLPDGTLRWKWDPNFLGNGAAPERDFGMDTLWDAAARVPVPALVVHGAQSDILDPAVGRRLAQTLPHGRFVTIEGSGHSVQSDNPHDLSEALERFLTQIGYAS
ncbi:MAG: alpha/beta fold hydrolase [Dehalococcoidia bacterium]